MKKAVLAVALMVATATILLAQNPVKRTSRITPDEVPLVVKSSFERDFGKIPQEGFWLVHFVVETAGEKTAAKPMWYSYNRKSKAEKAEARYSPQGELLLVKGLDRIIPAGEPESLDKPQKIG